MGVTNGGCVFKGKSIILKVNPEEVLVNYDKFPLRGFCSRDES